MIIALPVKIIIFENYQRFQPMDILMKKYTLLLLSAGLFLFFIGCSQPEVQSGETGEDNFYELRIYDAEPGKLDDLHARFRDHTLRLFEKHSITSIGYWVPIDNTENRLYFVLAYPNREARESSWAAFASDPEWIDAKEASEINGRLVANTQSIFLAETDYSPVVTPTVSETPRLFEFRIYKATPGNLERLHARFRNHTIGLFSKHGIEHFGYWSPIDVDNGSDDTLIYFMSHKDSESRDASFEAFRNDPDWLSAREASEVDAGGSLTVSVERVLMEAADYSPTK